MGRLKIGGEAIRAKAYPLMLEAVEVGVVRGWNRAHKHAADPHEDAIRAEIEQAVMTEICERFSFSDE